MAQATAVKPKTFTLKSSVAAMKNTIRISLSTLAFQRSLFPGEAFVEKSYCGTDLYILKPVKKANDSGGKDAILCEPAFQLCEYLEKGVFDALEKKYLERIIINVHGANPTLEQAKKQRSGGRSNSSANKPSSLIESYTFKVEFDDQLITEAELEEMEEKPTFIRKSKGNVTSPSEKTDSKRKFTREQVSKQTRNMIRRLSSLLTGLDELPKETWLSVYLTYNDTTPKDYQPKFFCDVDLSNVPMYEEEPQIFHVGSMETGFHALDLKIKTKRKRTRDPQNDSQDSFSSDRSASFQKRQNKQPSPSKDHFRGLAPRSSLKTQETPLGEWTNVQSSLYNDVVNSKVKSEPGVEQSVLQDITPSRPFGGSQDSFASNFENLKKISRAKRPVSCKEKRVKRK